VGDVTQLIALNVMAYFVVFLLVSAWKTLRKRKLTVFELMVHVAGFAVAFSIPQCFDLTSSIADLDRAWIEVRWASLCIALLSLAAIVLLVHRSCWK
jgi:hypothetical protein